MSDFGACKGCGRVYSLTRLKACPRCGVAETNSIEEVRIPNTTKRDFIFIRPEIVNESDLANSIDKILPATTSCKNCGRDYRSDKLDSCPRCRHQEQFSPPASSSSSNQFKLGPEFRCAFCNKISPQAFDFCPSCGAKLNTSTEELILGKFEVPPSSETLLAKTQSQSSPLSVQRQAKNTKVKNLVVAGSGIFIVLLLGALVLKGISSGSPAQPGNDENVDSNKGTSKIIKKCYDEWLPNPAYDPADFMSSKYFLHKVCQFVTINTP